MRTRGILGCALLVLERFIFFCSSRAALLEDEVITVPSNLRISELVRSMQLGAGDTVTSAAGGSNDGTGGSEDADADEESQIDRVVPVDHEALRSHLINITEETFAVADNHKSGTARTESEKWTDLHDRNKTAIRNRPARGVARAVAYSTSATTAGMDGKPAPRQHVPAADAGISKHISGPKMVAPAKKDASKQTIDWSERGDKGKVMLEGTGKVSVARPASAPGARQAWEDDTSSSTEHTPATAVPQSQVKYRPAAMAMAGGAAAALGARSTAKGHARGILDAQEPLCLIHEMIYCPQCPYPEVMEEVEHGFAAHQFGDCETALECYEDAYGMWVDACVENTGGDVHPEVKVFLLNAIGMVHQTAGRPEDTLAAFLDAKSEGNNLDPGKLATTELHFHIRHRRVIGFVSENAPRKLHCWLLQVTQMLRCLCRTSALRTTDLGRLTWPSSFMIKPLQFEKQHSDHDTLTRRCCTTTRPAV